MKIAEPKFLIINPVDREAGIKMLQFIEGMARISHKAENKQTETSWERFINSVVVQHGDWSVVEHQSATVLFELNRGITHELVRHRLFSYTQESTRFCNYMKEGFDAKYIPSGEVKEEDQCEWLSDLQKADDVYKKWLKKGYTPQIARDHLPTALGASISVTGNLRSWRWLFQARTSNETHPDFKRVLVPLLEEFKKRIPLLYDDLEPLQKQSISMAKVH